MRKVLYFLYLVCSCLCSTAQETPYLNSKLPLETRVQDLLKRMTLEEKAAQMNSKTPAIERLKMPAYNWWNEALHGVARAGLATSFPQPIGLAATFNIDAIFTMGTMVSDEARAKHHQFVKEGNRDIYTGLTFYSPNVNIFRDPRWGRGHETFGEDPYLTGKLGVAFVKSMQGDHPNYFKTITTAKHFAVHSGPEPSRHEFDAKPLKRDLWETYLPAFKMLTQDGHVYSFMCAYNRLYGKPCCSDTYLLNDILRKKWGFKGFVATDCGAVYDFFMFHKTAKDSVEAVAQAIKGGADNQCWGYAGAVIPAIRQGLLKESELDTAVARLLRAKFKLGVFDDDDINPYAKIPYSVVNNQKHQAHALQMAKEAIVLLKNNKQTLPLSKNIKNLAVIGPNANDAEILLGNYNGDPAHIVTPLEGIQKTFSSTSVRYAKGCNVIDTPGYNRQKDFDEALAIAAKAEVIVFIGGISPRLEGEELKVKVPGFLGGDKTDLNLPVIQTDLLKELKKLGKPIVLVLLNGSALSINWEQQNVDAIVETWYGGEKGGAALADVLIGNYNPAGRLPVTFYKSIDDLPIFEDYSMTGKTYRYVTKPVLYPFGYGLSYTSFKYSDLKLSSDQLDQQKPLNISFTVKNTGNFDGDEVVQLYISQAGQNMPVKELKGFKRINIKKGALQEVTFELKASDIQHYNEQLDDLSIVPGKIKLMIGSSSADVRLAGVFDLK
ncbi:glycoside hydrolase family 3 C-terminal domain-containing protein [Pedobacter cryotolerans]|uniref:Glycoside hydrolase family 3 protein n=1 Tax=Pedobacter cryotolerans TaxID=2571270 RepID=A0A4U1BYZ9_9SPHI|nr:glycoside hydrolase family 3 C-terminal domain-containing protein [Pedobacter cryotolerans]TKB98448.1 glycoside hydrolase family 3 protein [Pedobacter cryotolerans]